MKEDKHPRLRCSKDYARLSGHIHNRGMKIPARLMSSMRKHGFLAAFPLMVVPGDNRKLNIVSGHRRAAAAEFLKIPYWYVIDRTKVTLDELETKSDWSVQDFVVSQAKEGDKDCQEILNFCQRFHIPLGTAATLLGGSFGERTHHTESVRRGNYKVNARDHAEAVGEIVREALGLGVGFASSGSFVAALSLSLRVPEVSKDIMLEQVRHHASILKKRSTREEYLDELEILYNHRARSNRVNLKWLSQEVLRKKIAQYKINWRKDKKPA